MTATTRRSVFVQGRQGIFVGEGFTMPISRRTALAVLATIAVIFSVSFPIDVSAKTLHVTTHGGRVDLRQVDDVLVLGGCRRGQQEAEQGGKQCARAEIASFLYTLPGQIILIGGCDFCITLVCTEDVCVRSKI